MNFKLKLAILCVGMMHSAHAAGPFGETGYSAVVLRAMLAAIPAPLLKKPVSVSLAEGYFNAQDITPDSYKKSHALIWSLMQTVYYALLDSNAMNGNVSDWKFDMISMGNVPARGAYYAVLTLIENWSRDNKNLLPADEYARYVFFLGFLRMTGSMLSYNSRYEDTIIAKYQSKKEAIPGPMSSFLAGLAIAWDNFGWFYLVAMQSGFINEYYYDLLPRPAKFASTITRHVPIAVVIYSLTDALFTYGLICIKHTLFQLISPNPTDCSMCYFGTNVMGPRGAIGQYVFTARDAAFSWVYSWDEDL